MQDFEKLGVFYLGKEQDLASGKPTDNLILYDAKDLTTHAVVLGMTGSGKTGLCISLLEEAAIDGIPSLVIDPKGDIGNLLLAFPNLLPADFLPWVDAAEAARKGLTTDEYAKRTAEAWKAGLAEWGQDPARIRRLRDAVEMGIYTPGNTAGRPLQILRSFAAPGPAVVQDPAALRERILSAVSGLLGLLGMDADPVQSREHVLLSNILDRAWREDRSLDIAGLIGEIQKPPFAKVGVFDLESFYPARERFSLAMALNNLIASPGFSAWMEGEPLDIQRLLYTADGKPRVSILSIAHLSDAERMFFVTVLLNEVLAWVRAQSGTSSLRALLYMDEIYGYFPPNANPPSKTPMLTLLKQARAFGLGCVLSTQNPVDLDYKGLANAGTWLIGRLQTERDKMRVIEGLEGALASAGGTFDRAEMEATLAGLGNRIFLMRNVHDDDAVVFQSRWALSYLRGPMTLPQIRMAMSGASAATPSPAAVRGTIETAAAPAGVMATPAGRPVLPPGVAEFFVRPVNPASDVVYRPSALGVGKLHFVDAKAGVDAWLTRTLIAPLGENGSALWEEADARDDRKGQLDAQPQPGSQFSEVPAAATRKQIAADWQKTLAAHLYQNVTMDLIHCPALKLTSRPGESEGDFNSRMAQALREKRDIEAGRLRAKYAPRLQTLGDQLRRAQERVEREKAQAGQQKLQTVLSVGATLLGAFMGRKVASVGNLTRATSAARSASKIGKEMGDVARAGESVAVLQERLTALEQEFERETAGLQGQFEPSAVPIERTRIHPRKSDILTGQVGLCWMPWKKGADGLLSPA
jgi:hypothetical protein